MAERDERRGYGERVVITGIGLATPLGADRETTWQRLLAGESGIDWLTGADALPFERAGLSRPWGGLTPLAESQQLPGRDRTIALARAVAAEALRDAGLDTAATHVGCVFGASKGGLGATADWCRPDAASNARLPPFTDLWPSAPASELAAAWDLRGPLLTPVAACATGLAACLRAVQLLREGACAAVVAGSVDAALTPAVLASFRRLGVLAPPGDAPAQACRPFDRDRQGFAIGEGAACLIFEPLSRARARGARCYAEWECGLLRSDPAGLMQLSPDGVPLQRLIADLLRGNLPDALHLHGTGTILNDAVESQSLAAVLGSRLTQIPAVSVKGALGHLLGAAGSVELALAALSLRDQILPPLCNLQHSALDCPLPCLPRIATPHAMHRVLKLSLGFGGHLAGAVLKKSGE